MTFRVRFMPGAQENLDELDNGTADKIVKKADKRLSVNPYPDGDAIKRYTGIVPPLSRLKYSGWRIMFEIHESDVLVVAVVKKERDKRTIRKLRG